MTMVDSPAIRLAAAPIATSIWPAGRLLVDFALDIADIARDGGPVLDTLILTVVVEANLDAVNRDPALQRLYGGLNAPPPDDLRRPVSVNSVAASLGLPYETVRRHLVRMASLGQCKFVPGGVLVPVAQLTSPRFVKIAVARYERTRRLYHDLKAMGALPSLSAEPRRSYANPALGFDGAPVRLVNRLLSEYYLRLIELMMRRLGDPISALVVLGLARANMAALSDEARAAPGLLPETARQPVRRSALAAQLGLPAETVRRRLMELEQKGYYRPTRGGLMISIDLVVRPDSLRSLQENQANLIRFLSRLRRYGLLELWDAERTAEAGA
jgi:hypothetical protein